jgi:hypothetical protein
LQIKLIDLSQQGRKPGAHPLEIRLTVAGVDLLSQPIPHPAQRRRRHPLLDEGPNYRLKVNLWAGSPL